MREQSLRSTRVVTPDGVVAATVRIADGRIAGVEPHSAGGAATDLGDAWLIPGLIDTHVHGALGCNFQNGDAAEVEAICRYHAQHGTTGLLATTGAAPDMQIETAIAGLVKTVNTAPWRGAAVLGIHLEGPFLCQARRGAQDPESIQEPDLEKLKRWIAMGQGQIQMVTLAPERPGGLEMARWLRSLGIVAAAGHTDATYEQMREAVDAGVTHTIHTFNGMRGLHHREPGVAGAALDLPELITEVVADGYHVHPAVIRLILRAKGLEGMTLVTDAVEPAGLPDGAYHWERQPITVKNGMVMLADGSSLAGSTLTMMGAVRNVMQFAGLSLAEAVTIASRNPARVLGLADRKGAIAPGMDADLVVLDSNLGVQATLVAGQTIYNASVPA